MKAIPLRDLDEINKFVIDTYGSIENYMAKRYDNEVAPEPVKPIAKTESEISADYYDAVCAQQGISIDEFFKRNPDEWRKYRVRSYSK